MTYGIGNSPFGWDLPPGVTQRMIDDHFGGDEEPEETCSQCGATVEGYHACQGGLGDQECEEED